MRFLLGLTVLSALGISGCRSSGTHEVASGDAPEVVWYDATVRGQIVIPVLRCDANGSKVIAYKVVSEPPPDSVMQTALKATLAGSYQGFKGEGSVELSQTALKLASRTERVELLRSALFTLSQATVNLDMTAAQFQSSYNDVVRATLASTLAEAGTDATQAADAALRRLSAIEVMVAKLRKERDGLPSTASAEKVKDLNSQIEAYEAERTAILGLIKELQGTAAKYGEAAKAVQDAAPQKEDGSSERIDNLLTGAPLAVTGKPGLQAVGDKEDNKTISSAETAGKALLDGIISDQPRDYVGVWYRNDATYKDAKELSMTCEISVSRTQASSAKDKKINVVMLVDTDQRILSATKVTMTYTNSSNSSVSLDFSKTNAGKRDTWTATIPNDIPVPADGMTSKWKIVVTGPTPEEINKGTVQSGALAVGEIYIPK